MFDTTDNSMANIGNMPPIIPKPANVPTTSHNITPRYHPLYDDPSDSYNPRIPEVCGNNQTKQLTSLDSSSQNAMVNPPSPNCMPHVQLADITDTCESNSRIITNLTKIHIENTSSDAVFPLSSPEPHTDVVECQLEVTAEIFPHKAIHSTASCLENKSPITTNARIRPDGDIEKSKNNSPLIGSNSTIIPSMTLIDVILHKAGHNQNNYYLRNILNDIPQESIAVIFALTMASINSNLPTRDTSMAVRASPMSPQHTPTSIPIGRRRCPSSHEDSHIHAIAPIYHCRLMYVSCLAFPMEPNTGPIEYKLMVSPSTDNRLNQLQTQMMFRMAEGKGRAMYTLGIDDFGYPTFPRPTQSVQTVQTPRRTKTIITPSGRKKKVKINSTLDKTSAFGYEIQHYNPLGALQHEHSLEDLTPTVLCVSLCVLYHIAKRSNAKMFIESIIKTDSHDIPSEIADEKSNEEEVTVSSASISTHSPMKYQYLYSAIVHIYSTEYVNQNIDDGDDSVDVVAGDALVESSSSVSSNSTATHDYHYQHHQLDDTAIYPRLAHDPILINTWREVPSYCGTSSTQIATPTPMQYIASTPKPFTTATSPMSTASVATSPSSPTTSPSLSTSESGEYSPSMHTHNAITASKSMAPIISHFDSNSNISTISTTSASNLFGYFSESEGNGFINDDHNHILQWNQTIHDIYRVYEITLAQQHCHQGLEPEDQGDINNIIEITDDLPPDTVPDASIQQHAGSPQQSTRVTPPSSTLASGLMRMQITADDHRGGSTLYAAHDLTTNHSPPSATACEGCEHGNDDDDDDDDFFASLF